MIPAEDYVKEIFSRPTERDAQRKIGASNMSTSCSRCLADDLLGIERPQSVYDFGAVIGTAIHAYLEERNNDKFALPERKVIIGTIDGYGEISSTTDLVRIDRETGDVEIVDLKTTTRDKLAKYRKVVSQSAEFDNSLEQTARWTLSQYFRQAQLYAWGVEKTLRLTPSQVSIVFVCRDGQIINRDVWGHSMPYDKPTAKTVFNRTERMWAWLQDPDNDPNDLPEQDDCYFCNHVRPFMISGSLEL